MSQKYLRVLWSALLIRYGAIYLPLLLVTLFSGNSSLLLSFTIYYWIACCLLIVAEKFGSYTEVTATQIVQSYFYFKSTIPMRNVLSIKDGHAPGIIGNPKSVDMEFTLDDGRTSVRHILLHQFSREDIRRFVDELARRNSKAEVSTEFVKHIRG